jgi:hypothetical protein
MSTDYSHAEPANLACRACGAPVTAEVWVIVDAAARPDLLARLRAGGLHELTCPACGHAATINAPLLLVRPGAEPPLLFSPAAGDDPARDEEQAAGLLGLLRAHMGAAWRDEWLANGVVGVARAVLPALLGDDPATAARLAAAAAQAESDVPPEVRQALTEILAALAAEGVRVNTPEDLRRALEERPLLKARLGAALSGSSL